MFLKLFICLFFFYYEQNNWMFCPKFASVLVRKLKNRYFQRFWNSLKNKHRISSSDWLVTFLKPWTLLVTMRNACVECVCIVIRGIRLAVTSSFLVLWPVWLSDSPSQQHKLANTAGLHEEECCRPHLAVLRHTFFPDFIPTTREMFSYSNAHCLRIVMSKLAWKISPKQMLSMFPWVRWDYRWNFTFTIYPH